ncbi:MAG: hypothetical protein AB9835_00545 [Eubacteriales bacterium]
MSANTARKKLLKRILLIVAAVLLITGIVTGVLTVIENYLKDKKAKELEELDKPKSYIFFEPDYDENIFDDPIYMDKIRSIAYSDGIVKTLITDGDFSAFPPQVKFFEGYFDAAIKGDAETYNTLFTDEYYESNEKRDRFTMQKIHDIEVELLESYTTNTGKTVEYNIYKVTYTILKNNGTFRNDMPEGSYVPQRFELVTTDGVTKINSIKAYKTIYE